MYLGIDLGTSGVKAVLLDDTNQVLAESSAPLAVQRPRPLWSEQDPDAWWTASCNAVKALPVELRSATQAIGLSGQMHGATLIGSDHRALRPAILWNDGRSASECTDLEVKIPDLPEITGNRAMPGFTAPKLQWARTHEPDVFDQVDKVLLPKDYLRLRMSGDAASDLSDSSGTLWLNTAERDWSDRILAATGLTRDHMPKLYEGPGITGQLLKSVAGDWGMGTVPIVAGGGDNAAGAVGAGVISPGDGFLSLGTSGVIFVVSENYQPNPCGGVHTFCHALPGLWHQMAVILSAASAVDYVANLTGFSSPALLFAETQAKATLTSDTLFLPYLAGERTPHNDPLATGAFFGLTHATDRNELAQAALEGVAFALADGLDALRDGGAKIERLSVIGGGSRSDWWGQVLASTLNVTLDYSEGAAIGPAIGAARLARIGKSGNSVTDNCPPPAITNTIHPNSELSSALCSKRVKFKKLYEQTKDIFSQD